jgi:hypothetical protein
MGSTDGSERERRTNAIADELLNGLPIGINKGADSR